MQNTVVINVVGLSQNLLPFAKNIQDFAQMGESYPLRSVTPAVTCTAQSTFTTGTLPNEHGCVANGWYFRDLCEILFWRQPNKLVEGEKIWEAAKKRNKKFTCAKLFWWYNMYSSADFSVTPRPMYPADGRKIPDVYTQPLSLRYELNKKFGTFPLFNFWGPTANIASSKWIANTSMYIYEKKHPTLTLIYLPHLDYNLQRFGPNHEQIPQDVAEIDAVCGQLIKYFQKQNCRIIFLAEYGIHQVHKSISINRLLRKRGWLKIKEEMGLELLDPGASQAFAVADHQIAHIYLNDLSIHDQVKNMLLEEPAIEHVLDEKGKKEFALNHNRSGEIIALAKQDAWFNYYYWFNDEKAPDFARTVDIHRKPGYDPVELFIDPKIIFPKIKIASKLLQKKLGFRTLLDVIPLNPILVEGSHGRVIPGKNEPVFITNTKKFIDNDIVEATKVKEYILRHIFEN